jgi:hypothetical protein
VEKVVFPGTHRVRTPEQTLEIITPQLELCGITRHIASNSLACYGSCMGQF